MKKAKGGNVFGIVMIVALGWSNLLHLPWTVWLVWEQINTGWGGGTGIEMLGLAPWAIQMLSVPVLLAEIVYLVWFAFRGGVRGIRIANICLVAAAVLQFSVTNLFMLN